MPSSRPRAARWRASRPRRSGPAVRRDIPACRSASARTGANPTPPPAGTPASSTRVAPPATARWTSSATRRDLPMPLSPRTSTAAGRSRHSRSRRASSSARPTSAVRRRPAGRPLSPTTRHEARGSSRPLTFSGRWAIGLDIVADHPEDLPGDHDRARGRELLEPGGDVGRQAVDLALVDVEVEQPAVHRDPHRQRLPDLPGDLIGQAADGGGDVEARPHGPAGVVLVGRRVAEEHEQAVARDPGDVAAVTGDRVAAHPLELADGPPVGLRLEAARQGGRVDEVAEHDREAPELPGAEPVGGQQVGGLGVAGVAGQHLVREPAGRLHVAVVDGPDGPVEQALHPVGRPHPGHGAQGTTSTTGRGGTAGRPSGP